MRPEISPADFNRIQRLNVRTQIPGNQILDQGVDTADIKDDAVTDDKLSTTGVSASTYTKVTVNSKGRITVGENPTTLAGYGITDAQPLDSDLTALANTATTGLYAVTAAGTSATRSIAVPAQGLTITNANGVSGNPTLALANDLAAVEGLSSTGIAIRTAADTWTTRSIAAGSSKISISNADGVSGAPTIDVSESNLTLNNIGGTLGLTKGGTGLTSGGTANQVLGMNAAASAAEFKTITAGTGITVTHGVGTVTIAGNVGTVTSASVVSANGFAGTVATATSTPAITLSTTITGLLKGNGTAISAATAGTDYLSVLSGDVTTSGNVATLATVNASPVTAGFVKITTNGKGLTTATTAVTASDLYSTLGSQTAKTVLAAPTGASGNPSFRTISLGIDLSDVSLTSPASGNVLTYNGTNWVNSSSSSSAASGLLSSWTLVSGLRYYADFAHNLGTNNVVITLYDTNDNSVVTADSIVLTNTNTARITVIGNTRTLRVVVVANGFVVNNSTMSAGTITTAKDGVNVSTAASKLNFTGQAVSVVDAGGGTTNVTVGSRFTFFAGAFDSPNSSDWTVNALAPAAADPSNSAITVRQFSNTTEQGVGFMLSIPTGATSITFKFRGRAQTAPGAAAVVSPMLYARLIPNNSAMSAWAAGVNLSNIAIPTNAFYQYSNQTVTLSSLGLTAGNTYQIELTRDITPPTGTNLGSNYLLAELTVEIA